MSALDLARAMGHQELLFASDAAAGLRVVVAIHDTTLGPAVGGTRMRLYPTMDEAAVDALRLSRAMTYKAVMADMNRGGAKAVILGDPGRDKTPDLLAAYADLLNRLGGRFNTGPDMGIDGRDAAVLARMTRHVSHAPGGSTLQAADLTAIGVLEAMRAAALRWQGDLAGVHVAMQGLGQVGYRLARLLAAEGARLSVTDVDLGRVQRLVAETGAKPTEVDAIYEVDADIFSPNAAGGVIDDRAIARLRCRAVIGAANEQLLEPHHGDRLHERGILYGPDYVVNAGGLLSLLYEIGELDEEGVMRRVRGIGERVAGLWERAQAEGLPPHRVADRIVGERLADARSRRPKGHA
jgi:glutamate dehydrogenase/leucine dehydrogenase